MRIFRYACFTDQEVYFGCASWLLGKLANSSYLHCTKSIKMDNSSWTCCLREQEPARFGANMGATSAMTLLNNSILQLAISGTRPLGQNVISGQSFSVKCDLKENR